MFLDEITIRVQAGHGGAGAVHFLREKFMPKGGPDGGDGGRGGDVVFEVRVNLNTLHHLRHHPRFHAAEGGRGGRNNRTGADGEDLVIPVPPGTLIRDPATNVILKDLKTPGQRVVLCQGGRGGRGNRKFASPVRQTPRIAEPGGNGQSRTITLELRLIADVGCVGLPNAGKSTLVSRCSAARPRIANYPFTTLSPSLGIVAGSDHRSFVIADLPGLIEGAHAGAGLGDKFLRHIERTRLVLHLVDGAPLAPPDPVTAYRTIRRELEAYSPTLASKPEIVVLNKMDLPEAAAGLKALMKVLRGVEIIPISAATGEGMNPLLAALFERLGVRAPARTDAAAPAREAPSDHRTGGRPPVPPAPVPSAPVPLHRIFPGGPSPVPVKPLPSRPAGRAGIDLARPGRSKSSGKPPTRRRSRGSR
ncbi:MAG: GTPase ObgE [Planctomycetes bacterium]|nr:GTPase ObgE [Planctomycetota bacterium]